MCKCEEILKSNLKSIELDSGSYSAMDMIKDNSGWFIKASGEEDLIVKIKYCPFCGNKLLKSCVKEIYFDDTEK